MFESSNFLSNRCIKKCLIMLMVAMLLLAVILVPAATANNKVRIGGDVVVDEGLVVKDAVAVGGNVTVYGVVRDSAVAVGGSVFLGPKAVVRKDVVSIGGDIKKAPGAKIHGDMVELNIPGISAVLPFLMEDTSVGWFWAFELTTLFGLLALAAMIVALMPGTFDLISKNVHHNMLKVVLVGIVGLAATVPLSIFFVISIIGIPLVALEALMVGCAILIGYFAVAQLIGNRLAGALKRPGLNILWGTLLGLFILWAIGWVPFLGPLVKALAVVLGFGGVLATVFRYSGFQSETATT